MRQIYVEQSKETEQEHFYSENSDRKPEKEETLLGVEQE